MNSKLYALIAWTTFLTTFASPTSLCAGQMIIQNETLGTYRLGAEFATGRYIALDESYGEVSFFAVPEPSLQSIHLLMDLRGYKLEHKNWAASGGLGLRKLDTYREKVYGLNFYYDYRNQKSFSYNQYGIGFEILSNSWEFHINGYMPVGKKENLTSSRTENFDGGFFAVFNNSQYALRGVEVTGGWRGRLYDGLFIYAAPGFYFYNNNHIGNIQGVQGTAEVGWNDWISLRVNASYDTKFRGRVQGILAVSIPFSFGKSCNCVCCESQLLGRPVRRNDMIFLKKCCSVENNFDDCGDLID